MIVSEISPRCGRGGVVRRRAVLLPPLVAAVLIAACPLAAMAEPPDSTTVKLLARTMYEEARGDGEEGMLAIGWVVLNRSADAAFPRTVEAVVRHRNGRSCQWTWACRKRDAEPREGSSWRLALGLARELLQHPPPDPTGGALWIRRIDEPPPRFAVATTRTALIGSHAFFGRPQRRAATATRGD